MSDTSETSEASEVRRKVVDEYGNEFQLEGTELARGGQGVVLRTTEGDLAVKQPTDEFGDVKNAEGAAVKFRQLIGRIRSLPLPDDCHIALPVSALKDEPGYVMRLLADMLPYSYFTKVAEEEEAKEWCEAHPDVSMPDDPDTRCRLVHFLVSGSFRARYRALSKCAAELARLHAAGIVYGDVAPGNVFMKPNQSEVWLIDPDNLRLEKEGGAKPLHTPGYGAPEVTQGLYGGTSSSDAWAFAVMAFESLYLQHPFVGEAALSDEEAWDAADSDFGDEDGETRAKNGLFPYVDDPDDDSNRAYGGLPREVFSTELLRKLFYRTFGPGRLDPFVRVTAAIWAETFAREYDRTLICPKCGMTYDMNFEQCPVCDAPVPAFAALRYKGRLLVLQKPEALSEAEFDLPERFFAPFSLVGNDRPTHRVKIDFTKRTMSEVRLTRSMPAQPELSFFHL